MARERESKKASRHHHHSSSKKSKKKHSSSSRDKDRDERQQQLPKGVAPISDDDYFLRATEFRVWLAKTKDKYVEDLSTAEAMELFQAKFVKKWNRGRLASMYYEGIPEHVLEQTRRTKHKWGFTKTLSEKEMFDLATAKDSVGVATRKEDLLQNSRRHAGTSDGGHRSHKRAANSDDDAQDRQRHGERRSRSPTRHSHRVHEDSEDERERRHASSRYERKKHRKHHESVLDELVPKETGREAMLEKRRQVASKMHGAARDRDENRDGLDLSDDFLMGGGARAETDLQRRLKQREAARDRKQQEQNEKRAELEAKESARMDKFLHDMGISANSKPFTIAPRR